MKICGDTVYEYGAMDIIIHVVVMTFTIYTFGCVLQYMCICVLMVSCFSLLSDDLVSIVRTDTSSCCVS